MASAQEAIKQINEFTMANGQPVPASELFDNGGDDTIGMAYERIETVRADEVDERLSPSGVIVGLYACRAVLVLPEAAPYFEDQATELPLTLVQSRLTYQQPETNLSTGGTAHHMAAYTLHKNDGETIDQWFARHEQRQAAGERPTEPQTPIQTDSKTVLPEVHQYAYEDSDSETFAYRTAQRYALEQQLIQRLQRAHPEMDIVSPGHHGVTIQDELADLASWFVS